MGKLLLWTGLLCGLIFGGIALATSGVKGFGSMITMLGLILFGLLFLFVMITLVFFGNGYRVRYLVSTSGGQMGIAGTPRQGRQPSSPSSPAFWLAAHRPLVPGCWRLPRSLVCFPGRTYAQSRLTRQLA